MSGMVWLEVLALYRACPTRSARTRKKQVEHWLFYFKLRCRCPWQSPRLTTGPHKETFVLSCKGRSGVCSVRALKSVRLKAMFSWLAVRFSRDLGDLAICLGHSSSLSGRGSSTSEFLSSVHGVYSLMELMVQGSWPCVCGQTSDYVLSGRHDHLALG